MTWPLKTRWFCARFYFFYLPCWWFGFDWNKTFGKIYGFAVPLKWWVPERW